MTLTDIQDEVNNNNSGNNETGSVVEAGQIGQALVQVIKQALSQERVTLGIFECVDILETCPDQVMLCVLPKVTDDDMMINIQHKLIEAYCWENAVNLLKVDSPQKLSALLCENSSLDRTAEMSCVLVGFPTEDMSTEDYQICKLSYLFQENDTEPIPLPD